MSQNPVMKVDPTGLVPIDDLSGMGRGLSTISIADAADAFEWYGDGGDWFGLAWGGAWGGAGWCMFNPFKDCAPDTPDGRGQGCPGTQRFDENGICVEPEPMPPDDGTSGNPYWRRCRQDHGEGAVCVACCDFYDRIARRACDRDFPYESPQWERCLRNTVLNRGTCTAACSYGRPIPVPGLPPNVHTN